MRGSFKIVLFGTETGETGGGEVEGIKLIVFEIKYLGRMVGVTQPDQ